MKDDVSIVFPCLNEEATLDKCIKSVKQVMKNTKYKYEIIVSDNGSTDSSISIAKKNKVKVFNESKKGYGSALLNGIKNASGKYIVMLDSDCSYNAQDIPSFIKKLEEGNDLVIGNRFNKLSNKDSFILSHKIGAKLLSYYANILFFTNIKDYHCGLRAFNNKVKDLNLNCTGMEFASEMIIKSKIKKLKICNINTKYLKDERKNKSHLNPLKDGYRHLKIINKLKFDNSIIFRYLSVFIITLFICFMSLLLVAFKSDRVNMNGHNSIEYIVNSNLKNSKKNVKFLEDVLDYDADRRMITMTYLIDGNDRLGSIIRMNYLEVKHEDNETTLSNYETASVKNYARYWHGYNVILRPLMFITNIKYIYIILSTIAILLFLILLVVLFRNDKWLSIIFLLSSIVINTYSATLCLEYVFIFILTYIISLIIIHMFKKKSRNIDVLMLIAGMLTCFFDFLTVETISFTVPMFIYSYLCIKDKREISFRDIIKYGILWVIGYAFMFGSKWLIDIIYFGPGFFMEEIEKYMEARIYTNNTNILLLGFYNTINCIKYLFPFKFFDKSIFAVLLLAFIGFNNYFFKYKDLKKYIPFIILGFTPIVRYIVLSSHADVHMFFTYRAVISTFMMLALFIFRPHGIDKNGK